MIAGQPRRRRQRVRRSRRPTGSQPHPHLRRSVRGGRAVLQRAVREGDRRRLTGARRARPPDRNEGTGWASGSSVTRGSSRTRCCCPGSLWLVLFYVVPAFQMFISSFWSGTLEHGLHVLVRQLHQLHGRARAVRAVLRPFDRVRGRGDAADVPDRLSARLRHRVQGRARRRTCCCSWSSPRSSRASCCGRSRGRSSSATTACCSGRSRTSALVPEDFRLLATPIAVIAGHHLQLPAVHDAADLRRAGEGRRPPGRGREGPVRGSVAAGRRDRGRGRRRRAGGGAGRDLRVEPAAHGRDRRGRGRVHRLVPGVRVVRPGHVPAVAAGRLRRVAADVHPGDRRLRERRVPGQSRTRG